MDSELSACLDTEIGDQQIATNNRGMLLRKIGEIERSGFQEGYFSKARSFV
jgi:hypothetical protein